MESTNVDQVRQCCGKQKDFLIIYDGGTTPDLPVLVCKSCFDNLPVFQKFIKSKQFVTGLPNSKTLTRME